MRRFGVVYREREQVDLCPAAAAEGCGVTACIEVDIGRFSSAPYQDHLFHRMTAAQGNCKPTLQ